MSADIFGIFLKTGITGIFIIVPLALKWRFHAKTAIKLYIYTIVIGTLIISALNSYMYVNAPALVFIAFGVVVIIILYHFFRDPERKPEKIDKRDIYSPADGTVRYIKKIEAGENVVSKKDDFTLSINELCRKHDLPPTGFLIGVSMSFLDVHVNRAPITGKVLDIDYVKGPFLSLRRDKNIIGNERCVTVIESADGSKIIIIQIASRLVRRIVNYTKTNQQIIAGERIGKIIFGSQVDIFIPDEKYVPGISTGDYVYAGKTILMKKEC